MDPHLCVCKICDIARLQPNDLAYAKFKQDHSNPVGTTTVSNSKPFSPPARTLQVCSKCFAVIGKGKGHICSKINFQLNVSEIVKNKSAKSRGKVTSSILKTVAADQSVTLRGGQVNLPSGSNILHVKLGTPKVVPKPPRFSHENLKRIQAAHNLSDKAIK